MRPGFCGRMAGALASVLLFGAASAQTVISTTGTALMTTSGTANLIVDSNLSLTGTANITKATVAIASGYQSGDLLSAGSLPAGITGSFNAASGVLTLTGSATPADYQAALRSIRISLSTNSNNTRGVTFSVGELLSFTNGHFYQYVTSLNTWAAAKAGAASMNYYGLTGYLATITSVDENTFIQQKLSSDGWVGASDDYAHINLATGVTTFNDQAAAEGHWYWVTGPEKGTNFSNGNATPATVNGRYAKWNSGEPNNSGTGEHYGEIYSSGTVPGAWNDLSSANTLGYVVEYGGMPGDPLVQLSAMRSITVQQTSITGTYNSGSYSPNAPAKVVDNSLSLYAAGNITDARVTISSGKQTGDVLAYTGSLPSGITSNYNAGTGVLSFNGTATPAQFQALLRTVTFSANSGANINRTITFSLGSNVSYSNGHFYQYVAAAGISWATAKANAAAMNYYGLTGYLTTITSAGENAFITQKLSSDGWMGASDDYAQINAATGATTFNDQAASEGHWYWVTGPEKGTNFSNGNATPATVSGRYANWNTGEPNNTGTGGEHYGQIFSNGGTAGTWNDLNGSTQNGYVVEFGGLASDPAVVLSSSSLVAVGSPLPLRGLQLAAAARGTTVALRWETLNEQQVHHFEIERSQNGSDFRPLGTMAAAGNGDHGYDHLDSNPLPGINYYRIRSVDADGTASYSTLASAIVAGPGAALRLFPNPAGDVLNIVRGSDAPATAVVTDLSGRSLLRIAVRGTSSSIGIHSLPAGMYLLQLEGEAGSPGVVFIKK